MFKIDGVIKDSSLEFFIFRPNLGKTGRMWPLSGSPRTWITLDPFHAEKKIDIYCQLDIRSKEECRPWKDQDWKGYLKEMWRHNDIVPRFN
jgi:hypothetical protein